VQGDDTTGNSVRPSALKNNVTAALPDLEETQSFKSTDQFCP
jgi:hypothetical protein